MKEIIKKVNNKVMQAIYDAGMDLNDILKDLVIYVKVKDLEIRDTYINVKHLSSRASVFVVAKPEYQPDYLKDFVAVFRHLGDKGVEISLRDYYNQYYRADLIKSIAKEIKEKRTKNSEEIIENVLLQINKLEKLIKNCPQAFGISDVNENVNKFAEIGFSFVLEKIREAAEGKLYSEIDLDKASESICDTYLQLASQYEQLATATNTDEKNATEYARLALHYKMLASDAEYKKEKEDKGDDEQETEDLEL